MLCFISDNFCFSHGCCFLLVLTEDRCFHFDADPYPTFYFDADPVPSFQSDADPDPTIQSDTDPDPTFFEMLIQILNLSDSNIQLCMVNRPSTAPK